MRNESMPFGYAQSSAEHHPRRTDGGRGRLRPLWPGDGPSQSHGFGVRGVDELVKQPAWPDDRGARGSHLFGLLTVGPDPCREEFVCLTRQFMASPSDDEDVIEPGELAGFRQAYEQALPDVYGYLLHRCGFERITSSDL